MSAAASPLRLGRRSSNPRPCGEIKLLLRLIALIVNRNWW
ncbi:hypothetical protein CASFOL_020549 [Castilleja foliolosa]|uniref:Uncharacterized protein n=1 Tax=Castilleja foliolosa TaxID=1961234 RepID=A0ABD3D5F9_9LAMI